MMPLAQEADKPMLPDIGLRISDHSCGAGIEILLNPQYVVHVSYGGRVYEIIRYIKPQNKNANTKVSKKVVKIIEPHLQ